MDRPQTSEYDDYYGLYVNQVPDGDISEILGNELRTTLDLLGGVEEGRWAHRYAPGKWTLGEVVGHMVDVERTFGFRAFWFARADPGELPSMDQDHFARESRATQRSPASLLGELEHLRRSHLLLFESFDEATSLRRGIASGCEFTVRAIAYIMAGHEIHHRRVIEERY